MATHSSVLAWRIPGTGEPGGLPSMDSLRVGHDWSNLAAATTISFPLFLCIDHWGRLSYLSLLFFGTLHSNRYIFPFLLCFMLLFYSQLFIRSQITILPLCISFSFGWSWSLPSAQCHEPLAIVLQAFCLSDVILWIFLSLPLYNCKGFDLGHIWMA